MARKQKLPADSSHGGYVLFTQHSWLNIHAVRHRGESVYFPRGPHGALKSLPPGGLLVFLEHGIRPHIVAGVGTFLGNEVTTSNAAWAKYGDRLGIRNGVQYSSRREPTCLLHVGEFQVVMPSVRLATLGIESKAYASRGWHLTDGESFTIISSLNITLSGDEVFENFGPSGSEGRRVQKLHLVLERDRGIVKEAKQTWAAKDPAMRCEVCKRGFNEMYGPWGDGFIEAHHRTPLSELEDGATARTRIEDLAPVCANCHRMLHRNGGISIKDLKAKLETM